MGHADVFHTGFVENAAQEYVEIQCLYNIMKGEDLPDPDAIQTTYSAYLLGLCDVVGELRRGALDSCWRVTPRKQTSTRLYGPDL